MTTTTHETIEEWASRIDGGAALGEALGMTPCDTLHMLFPAIVGDDETMSALAQLLDPVVPAVAGLEAAGVIPAGEGEGILHDLFHVMQIAAGLGHMIGVAETVRMTGDLDTGDVEAFLASLPDSDSTDDVEAGQEDS